MSETEKMKDLKSSLKYYEETMYENLLDDYGSLTGKNEEEIIHKDVEIYRLQNIIEVLQEIIKEIEYKNELLEQQLKDKDNDK